MCEYEGERFRAVPTRVDEMDAEFVDRRPELWKGVQLAFLFAPIEVVLQ